MRQRPDYFYTQSAVIPFRERNGKLQILMISSRKKKRWVLPKGVKEPELTPVASAAKEALEEAGAEGPVSERIGRYECCKWGGVCTVDVFAMKVDCLHDDWEESHRDREWVSLEEAVRRADEAELKRIIQDLPRLRGSSV